MSRKNQVGLSESKLPIWAKVYQVPCCIGGWKEYGLSPVGGSGGQVVVSLMDGSTYYGGNPLGEDQFMIHRVG